MKNAFLWFGIVTFFSAVTAKSDYFPAASEEEEEDYKKLQEIARFLRKRVEEAETSEEAPEESDSVAEVLSQSSRNELSPPFEYSLPTVNSDEFQPFAVGPFDPRFYQDFGRPVEATSGIADVAEEDKEKRPRVEEPQEASTGASDASDASDAAGADPAMSYVRQVPVPGVYDDGGKTDIYFTAIVAGCSAAAVVAVIAIGIGCYRLQKNAKAAADVEYPAYGVTGPNKDASPTSGDRRLAQSAQMYHYQHQKQQIIALESMGNKERRSSISDVESEEENEEGDYTVYECQGLAPTGEMEVKNPLFQDDQTPASKPTNGTSEESRELPNLISFEPADRILSLPQPVLRASHIFQRFMPSYLKYSQ